MLEGKLITIPALGHENKGKSSFTGSVLFVLMSHYGNNNKLALQHGGFCTTWSLVAKGLLKVIPRGGWKLHEMSCKQERTTAILRFHRLTTFYTGFWSHFSSKAHDASSKLAAKACLAMCLRESSSRHSCSCLLCWILQVFEFACSVDLCGSLLWSPILPTQRIALPTLHSKWVTVDIGLGNFSTEVPSVWWCWLAAACKAGSLRLPWNLPAVPCTFPGPPTTFDSTSSQAHQLVINLE